MKAVVVVVAVVYRGFETVMVPDTRIKQVDGLMGAPVGNNIMLGLREIGLAKI
jgi:hypothetical protein